MSSDAKIQERGVARSEQAVRQSIDALRSDGGHTSNQQEIADELGRLFSKIVGKVPEIHAEEYHLEGDMNLHDSMSKFEFKKVKEEDVLKLLKRLDPNKAVGADGIGGKLLRMVAPGICRSLTSLYNSSLKSGQVPRECKVANVTPVPKGGDKEDVVNYRPVSVLPVVVKVFEALVHEQLYNYLQQQSLLAYSAQFGFRPGHSTQDALVSMVEEWRESMDEDKLVGSVFIDLSKAFDMVDHSILLLKMERYGVMEKELSCLRGYLSDRRQRVCVGVAKSEWTEVKRGVPQGSILGPLRFILYANNLPQVTKNSTVTQYADDTTLTVVADDAASLELQLNEDLSRVRKWADDNKLLLNTRKTQLLLLERKRKDRKLSNVKVSMDGEELERSRLVKCLGVILNDALTWREQVESVRRKCFTALAKLRRLKMVLPSQTKQVYNALVLPHLDYCSVVWQECSAVLAKKLERVQNYGMRLILSRPSRTHSEELREELGWKTLATRRNMARMMLVHRCVVGQAPAILCERVAINNHVTRGINKLLLRRPNSDFFKNCSASREPRIGTVCPII